MAKLAFGSHAQDSVTKFSGIVTGRTEYDTGCVRYCITPTVDADGKIRESEWCDESRLAGVTSTDAGGPQPNPKRNADPS